MNEKSIKALENLKKERRVTKKTEHITAYTLELKNNKVVLNDGIAITGKKDKYRLHVEIGGRYVDATPNTAYLPSEKKKEIDFKAMKVMAGRFHRYNYSMRPDVDQLHFAGLEGKVEQEKAGNPMQLAVRILTDSSGNLYWRTSEDKSKLVVLERTDQFENGKRKYNRFSRYHQVICLFQMQEGSRIRFLMGTKENTLLVTLHYESKSYRPTVTTKRISGKVDIRNI